MLFLPEHSLTTLDTVHHMDALMLLRGLPDGYIDMGLMSPPYDNLRTYNGYTWDFEGIAQELYRVIKPGGVLVWVVGDATIDGSETLTSFKQALYFKEQCGFNMHDTMIYEVAGTGAKGSNLAYWQTFEYMFVLSKGNIKCVNRIKDYENKWVGNCVKRGRKALQVGTRLGDYTVNRWGTRTNIWRYHAGNNGDDCTLHPAPFPESLAQDHILSWSNPGDIVLDCFMGSGTTAKMARYHKRHYIGCDISREYVLIARERLRQPWEPHHVKPNNDVSDLPLFQVGQQS